MEKERRFRVEFSGKDFPSWYPVALTIPAPDESRAREWADRQLQAWKLGDKKIRVSLVEVFAEVPSEEDAAPDEKPVKKKGKKRGNI